MPSKSVFQTALTDVWTAAEGVKIGDKPGDIRWERSSAGMKCYKCVILENTNAVTPVVGMAAYYYADAGAVAALGYDVHNVTFDATDSSGIAAGIFVSAPTTTGDRCWLQIKGFATLHADTLNADVTDGGTLTAVGAAADGQLDLPTDIDDPLVGIVIDESADTIICDFPF